MVKNASNPSQVKEAQNKYERERKVQIDDLRAVLSTPQGRRLLWRLMSECKVFGSIWDNSARIHYNAGRQDVGHFVLAEIVAASEDSYLEMIKENRKGDDDNVR
jgi:hypothetical protein